MTIFHDPTAPAGVVITRGIEFVDGRTADVDVSKDTRALFAAMGITEIPNTPEVVESPTKPAESRPEPVKKPSRK